MAYMAASCMAAQCPIVAHYTIVNSIRAKACQNQMYMAHRGSQYRIVDAAMPCIEKIKQGIKKLAWKLLRNSHLQYNREGVYYAL
jgi:hypothetical protein